MIDKNLNQHKKPIFIQALWRSGSTYVWRKFRENSDLHCYAKPFHHSLSKSAIKLQQDFQRVSKRFEFDDVQTSYYDEYESGPNGVINYDWKFAVNDYTIPPDNKHPEMEEYISGLIKQARKKNKRPLLKFNRGALRANWLQDTFGATSLYLTRSPAKMLESYNRLAGKRVAYYLACYMGIIGENQNNPIFSEMSDYLGIKPKNAKNFREHFIFYNRIAHALPDDKARDIVGFFWALGLVNSATYASDCLDMELSAEIGAKAKCIFSKTVLTTTRARVDFSDLLVKDHIEPILHVSQDVQVIVQGAIKNLHLSDSAWRKFDNFSLASNTRQQLTAIIG